MRDPHQLAALPPQRRARPPSASAAEQPSPAGSAASRRTARPRCTRIERGQDPQPLQLERRRPRSSGASAARTRSRYDRGDRIADRAARLALCIASSAPGDQRDTAREFAARRTTRPSAASYLPRVIRRTSMAVNVIYKTSATATGGRDGAARSDDGSVDVKLVVPKEMGGPGGDGANPEKLFAAGYAACFLGAMKAVSGKVGVKVPHDATVTAEIGFGPREEGGSASPPPDRDAARRRQGGRRAADGRGARGLPLFQRRRGKQSRRRADVAVLTCSSRYPPFGARVGQHRDHCVPLTPPPAASGAPSTPAPACAPPASRRAARRGAKCGAVLSAGVARLGPLRDRAQRADELVERRLALGLGRLDQHRAVDDEREIHRHRVEALVDQPLGDVERREALGEPVVARTAPRACTARCARTARRARPPAMRRT